MISHYYLQRAETRSERHEAPAAAYAAEKGVAFTAEVAAQAAGLDLSEVESAATSARWMGNVVAQKKKAAARGRRRR